MIERAITPRLLAALRDTPAVMLVGPRQAGKSTLVRMLADGPHPARYLTLDDLRTLEAARRDPVGLIESADQSLIVDEIQRAPELLLPMKAAIDRDRRPGRFILTGSAEVMLLPTVSESLAGRIEVHTLWPLSQAEIAGVPGRFATLLLGGSASAIEDPPAVDAPPTSREDLIERLVRGGFPEALEREDDRREEWLAAYLAVIVQRDLRDLANIERLAEVPAVLSSIASRVRAPLNETQLSSSVGVPRTSLHRYLTLLEHVFLVRRLSAWHTNRIKQLTKAPKMLISDSALLTHLLRADRGRLTEDGSLLGGVLESFVGMEICKQLAALGAARASLHHMRAATGAEVDFVLEGAARRLAGVEVKASATVRNEDFKQLASMRDRVGERFLRGVVLYTGGERLPFGERLEAWPLAMLWTGQRSAESAA